VESTYSSSPSSLSLDSKNISVSESAMASTWNSWTGSPGVVVRRFSGSCTGVTTLDGATEGISAVVVGRSRLAPGVEVFVHLLGACDEARSLQSLGHGLIDLVVGLAGLGILQGVQPGLHAVESVAELGELQAH